MNLYSFLAIAVIWAAIFASASQDFVYAIFATIIVMYMGNDEKDDDEDLMDNFDYNEESCDNENCSVCQSDLEDINDPYLTMNGHETSSGPVFPTSARDGQVHFLEEEDGVKVFHYDGLENVWTLVGNLPRTTVSKD